MDTSFFGAHVFSDEVMRSRLPANVYKSLKKSIQEDAPLDMNVAQMVANEMKEWAVSLGATHYTHWFQPMTEVTAGKHDAFLSPTGDGKAIYEFSSKALVRGEPDASSFPSGGLRSTFEARGYTAWDPTSPVFVHDGTLYIPTAFCSYTGEALDTKTPLLRSMDVLSEQACRLARILGHYDVHRCTSTVGAEQEYFLIDRTLYKQRMDLRLCHRTLLGARAAKGQEMDDHYCGRIRPRISNYMKSLDEKLWALGVPSKTKHNEVAPGQYEMAPVYENTNIACDHNQLTMEIMRVTARENDMSCVLHEKPFAGVNGSGKHNNYSIASDTGLNFLSPGDNPQENLLFIATVTAFIKGVDEYADLIRMTAACAGNEHRLGACEAPPAIISMYLGDNITQALYAFANEEEVKSQVDILDTGAMAIPELEKDNADRNRTSPFAFTGNKFEFRMVGSSQSIAMPNIVINTIIADVFREFADRLCDSPCPDDTLREICAEVLRDHGRILFGGDNYSQQWVEEAKRRGLPIINSCVEAFEAMVAPKNEELFARNGVFQHSECHSRYEIMMENYINTIHIEAAVMLEMIRRQITPACITYTGKVAGRLDKLKACGMENRELDMHLSQLNTLLGRLFEKTDALQRALDRCEAVEDLKERAQFTHDQLLAAMDELRQVSDTMEVIVGEKDWPLPSYTQMLHTV